MYKKILFLAAITVAALGVSFSIPTITQASNTCGLNPFKAYKTSNSSAVYYVTPQCTKQPFQNSAVYFTYFDSWSSVNTVSAQVLNSIPNNNADFMPWGPKHNLKNGSVIKQTSRPEVYVLLNNELYEISSAEVFNNLGFQWSWIEDVDERVIRSKTIRDVLIDDTIPPLYAAVKYANSPKVFQVLPSNTRINSYQLRYLDSPKMFDSYNYRWDRILVMPDNMPDRSSGYRFNHRALFMPYELAQYYFGIDKIDTEFFSPEDSTGVHLLTKDFTTLTNGAIRDVTVSTNPGVEILTFSNISPSESIFNTMLVDFVYDDMHALEVKFTYDQNYNPINATIRDTNASKQVGYIAFGYTPTNKAYAKIYKDNKLIKYYIFNYFTDNKLKNIEMHNFAHLTRYLTSSYATAWYGYDSQGRLGAITNIGANWTSREYFTYDRDTHRLEKSETMFELSNFYGGSLSIGKCRFRGIPVIRSQTTNYRYHENYLLNKTISDLCIDYRLDNQGGGTFASLEHEAIHEAISIDSFTYLPR